MLMEPLDIATDAPPAPPRIRQNIRLVREQPKAWAALEKLVEDPVLLQRLRRGAYETAQGYSWPRIAERTLALYEQAAKAKLGYEAESSRRA